MESQSEGGRISALAGQFSAVSGLRCVLLDANGMQVGVPREQAPFCAWIGASPQGSARCAGCIAAACRRVRTEKRGYLIFRCHAGLLEVVMPLLQDGVAPAYLLFGQTLAADDTETQWLNVLQKLDWMDQAAQLRVPFLLLKRTGEAQLRAAAELLKAAVTGTAQGGAHGGVITDEQRLKSYIDAHYAEQLSLSGIAQALSMSKTKLCAVASRQRTTVRALLNTRRMEAAANLLRHSGMQIGEIAAQVGVRDCNYFTKLFKAQTGQTPRGYRNTARTE